MPTKINYKLVISLIFIFFGASMAEEQLIKKAVFAGQFYHSDPARLRTMVDSFLQTPTSRPPLIKPVAMIVPHAGYIYSGSTAGKAYGWIKGGDYRTVVIIGPSHRFGFSGCSIWPGGGFETPLGILEVDSSLASEIMNISGFKFIRDAFEEEHSLEVQLPFIRQTLPDAKIVPIVMGYQSKQTIQILAKALEQTCTHKNVLVIASTDLSHYLPKAKAAAVDAKTIALIEKFDAETIIRKIEADDNFACGAGPVAAVLLYAQKQKEAVVRIIERTDSSSAGDPVVGYLAAVVLAAEGKKNNISQSEDFIDLTEEEKQQLLALARTAISEYITNGTIISPVIQNQRFNQPGAAFVTITKHGKLRGCIGYSEPVAPLARVIIQAAILAATRDSRFSPVRPEELKSLEVEISVLTPLKEINNPNKVQAGRHGVLIVKGESRGLLLPQVAKENGWNRDTFLEQACLKAGLPPTAWRGGAKIYVFEAVVFRSKQKN